MQKTTATLLILLGGTCMSFAGLFIRLVNEADGFQILAYRSLGIMAVVMVLTSFRRRISPLSFVKSIDKHDALIGFVMSLAFAAYVFAMLMTTVASTLFILTSTPFITAILGWLMLGERPSTVIWLSMLGALLGVGIMISDGFELGQTSGNMFAIAASILFALGLVLARKSKKNDVLGAIFMAGAFSSLLGFAASILIGKGIAVSGSDLAIMVSMGLFTIGLGIVLVFWGTPFVPAAEVSLLVLIESVLGPIWVWVLLGEAMSRAEIIGGSLVIAAVALSVIAGNRAIKHKALQQ